MATRRVLKAVLHNFLGTFTSRYSSYDRYWLMGFLVSEPGTLDFDLLTRSAHGQTPTATAADLAVLKFRDQVMKHGLDLSQVRSGRLMIEKMDPQVEGTVDGRPCFGYRVRVVARATDNRDRTYEMQRVLFVAPHNPQVERRSSA